MWLTVKNKAQRADTKGKAQASMFKRKCLQEKGTVPFFVVHSLLITPHIHRFPFKKRVASDTFRRARGTSYNVPVKRKKAF